MSLVSTSTWRAGLVNLHAGHQSEDSMLRRAGQLIYRPDIDARVEQKQQQCQEGEIQPPSHPSDSTANTITSVSSASGNEHLPAEQELYIVGVDWVTGSTCPVVWPPQAHGHIQEVI